MLSDTWLTVIGGGVLAFVQLSFRARLDTEREEKKALMLRIESLETRLAVFREEQIKDIAKLDGISDKLDRALNLLEKLAGNHP